MRRLKHVNPIHTFHNKKLNKKSAFYIIMAKKLKTEELILEARSFIESYKAEIGKSVKEGKNVILLNFDELGSFSIELADNLIEYPEETLQIFEVAMEESGLVKNPKARLIELPDPYTIKIRNIRAKHLNKLIQIEGIVKQSSEVRPQVVNAKFECPSCGTLLSILQIERKFREPSRCSCGRKSGFKLLSKDMVDAQRIVIEESPEELVGGEQPRRIQVFLKEDLVEPKMEEKTTPGSKVRVVGTLKEIPIHLPTGSIQTRFDLAIESNNIIPLEESFEDLEISDEDEKQIRELAADPKIVSLLVESIAPSIFGYEEMKKAIALQLFGGVKKDRSDATKSRGDIHILLVGDPGCLIGDERIVLGNGTIERIENLGSTHLEEINTQILTGEGGKKRDMATVFHYYRYQPVIEVITESGKSIKGTPNHPLLCVSNKNGKILREWKRLDMFRVGDKVAAVTSIPCTITNPILTNFKPTYHTYGPKFKGVLPKFVTEELGAFLGYLVGDGWVQKTRVDFVVSEQEIDILPKLLKLTKKLFDLTPKINKRKLADGKKVQLYYATINSSDIAENLLFLKEKRVPELIFHSGNKVASNFLKWLFEADGCVFNKGRGRRSISFKAKNIELLRDVQILLLRFSIHSRIVGNSLMIRRGKEIIKFAEKIGFVSKKKQTILKELAKKAKKFRRFNSQRSEKIIKILKHPNQDVFDIEVPNTHRFIANGIISHNTAKSVILKFISSIAPKGRYVAGKGASAAGITATVVRDDFIKGWSLEGGAMVLSNRGLICIDELEKMDEHDRSAMHEAMEQGSVSISKANIQATLRAETSVLAAANPKFGRFDPYQPISQQIDLAPSLLNRFDVIFTIRDLPDRAKDEAIATHVLSEHKHERASASIDTILLRKYIAYARQRIKPVLTEEAVHEIKKFYVDLRNMPVGGDSLVKPIPISARQLEALIRLGEAHAKIRLSSKIIKEDALAVIELIKYYLMQVGYDYETKTFDIDKLITGVTTSQRNKVIMLRETISRLESRLGKLIPLEELKKELIEKMSEKEIDEALEKLAISGDIFYPRKGYVQKV